MLLDHWVQFALITPVMLYTGWPSHRSGWLSLAHRNADMKSLITLGTLAATRLLRRLRGPRGAARPHGRES